MVADEKMEEDLDFFLNNNVSQKIVFNGQKKIKKVGERKLRPYSTSRIKSRNFLKNISYTGVKEEDLYDRNFIFNTHFLITKNINPFSLERKIYDVKDREMIQMFWS